MNFLPQLAPYSCTGLITRNFHRPFRLSVCSPWGAIWLPIPASSVIVGFLRFKAERIVLALPGLTAAAWLLSLQAFSRASGVYCCVRKGCTFWCGPVCDTGFCWRFPPSREPSPASGRSHAGGILPAGAENAPRLEALACFVASSWPHTWLRCEIIKVLRARGLSPEHGLIVPWENGQKVTCQGTLQNVFYFLTKKLRPEGRSFLFQ